MNTVFAWAIPNFPHDEHSYSNHLELMFVNSEAFWKTPPLIHLPLSHLNLKGVFKSAHFTHVTDPQLFENKKRTHFVKAVVKFPW